MARKLPQIEGLSPAERALARSLADMTDAELAAWAGAYALAAPIPSLNRVLVLEYERQRREEA